MDGFDALAGLRREGDLPESSRSRRAAAGKLRGFRLGDDGHAVEPFDSDEALAHIRTPLRRTGRLAVHGTGDRSAASDIGG